MAEHNIIHVRSTPEGTFDLTFFPAGTLETIDHSGWSAEAVAAALLAAPQATEILSFDDKGDRVAFHQAVKDELRARGMDFVPPRPCTVCKGLGETNGGACPECGVPWRGPEA